ncbi:fimbrial protein [Herbaspirillum sp. alder98]|uniref:fimbrial protein n=1 Tax=Herbaspirillum sp. alder98 TaxID=2913096 RepID=UPI001CD8D444|nr:fimbrial protein [Herbaspirillum sp. alder98]MCA1326603.1 type 1 fimbrial protein [Herbaspirillum sp. alder98]
MSNSSIPFLGGGLLRRTLSRIFMLLALSLMLADAQAVICRLNDIAGPSRYPLNVGTIEVPPVVWGINYFWRSPLQRVQVACQTPSNEYTDQPIVIHVFPQGVGLNLYGLSVGIAIEYKGKIVNPYQDFPIDTGYRTKAGETTYFTLEYYVHFWHGNGDMPNTATLSNVILISIHPAWDRHGASTDHMLYQVLNGSFVPRPARTCQLSVGDGNRTVRLPTISANSLSSATPYGGRVNFDLRLNSCSAAVNRAAFAFSGQIVPGHADYFANQGTASGVALHVGMREGNQTLTPQGPNNVASVAVVGQQATLSLFAQYYRTGAVTAGTVNVRAEFLLTYY